MTTLAHALGIGALAVTRRGARPPVIRDDVVVVDAGSAASGDLLANDDSNVKKLGDLRVVSVEGGAPGAAFLSPLGATVTIDPDGRFTYDATAAFGALPLGAEVNETIGYRAEDAAGGGEGALVVTVRGRNAPPVVATAPADLVLTLGEAMAPVDLSAAFADPGDALRFSASGLPEGLALDPVTGALTGAPVAETPSATVRVTATDSAGQTAGASFATTVSRAGPQLATPIPAQAWSTREPIAPIELAAHFAAEPAVVGFRIAPGSDALPKGVTMSRQGVIAGAPDAHWGEPRTLRVRAFDAAGGFTDVAIVATLTLDNILPAAPPTFTPNGVTTETLAPRRFRLWSSQGDGKDHAHVSWRMVLIPGETYELSGRLRRGTATGAIYLRAASAASGFLGTDVAVNRSASSPNDLDLTGAAAVSFIAPVANCAVGAVWIHADADPRTHVDTENMRLRPLSAAAMLAAVTAIAPPVTAEPALASPTPILADLGTDVSISLAGVFENVSRLALDPASEALPEGLSLSGDRIVGRADAPGTYALAIRGYNDQEEYVTAAVEFSVATILPEIESVAPVFYAATENAAFDVAALFAFTPERLDILPTGEPLPEGLSLDPASGRLEGTPFGVTDEDGAVALARAFGGGQAQTLALRVIARGPTVSAITGGWNGSSGVSWRTETLPDGTRLYTANNDGNSLIGRRFTLARGVRARIRVVIERGHVGWHDINLEVRPSYASAAGRSFAADYDWSESTWGDRHRVIFHEFTVDAANADGAGNVALSINGVKAGQTFRFVEFDVYDPNAQQVVPTGRNFDVAHPVGVPFSQRVGDLFVNQSGYAIAGLPEGLSFDSWSGLITGTPTVAGDFEVAVTGRTAVDEKTAPLRLAFQDGALAYPNDVFGPRDVAMTRFGGYSSAIARTGPSRWRVERRAGPGALAIQRLWGLTRGARYRISIATERGTLPAGARITATAVIHHELANFSGTVPLGEWAAAEAGVAGVEFVAPDNNPWIRVEAEADGSQFFHLDGIAVTPVAGDEPVPGGGARVDSVTGDRARLFNLEHGARYRLSLAASGADAITLALFANGANATDSFAPGATEVEFVAEAEILHLTAAGGTWTTPPGGLVKLSEDPSRAPEAVPEPGTRFPFLDAYPDTAALVPDMVVDPAGGANVHTTLQSALDAARGGETILLRSGWVGNISLANRRFSDTVTVIAEEQYGAGLTMASLTGVRKLTLRGLRFAGGIILDGGSQDLTIVNNLFDGGLSGFAIQTRSANTGEHFHLRIRSNDFVGKPNPADYSTNTLGKAIGIFNIYNAEISGNRFIGVREDCIVFGGTRTAMDHNLILETYPWKGTVNGKFYEDHTDALQLQQPFRRYNSWLSWRSNVVADDLDKFTGGGPVMHGLWSGGQTAGGAFLTVENNAIHSQNPVHGVNFYDQHVGYQVRSNTLWGMGPISHRHEVIGWSTGEVSGNIARSIAVTPGVRRSDNGFWGQAYFDTDIWADVRSIYGLQPKPGGPADAGGPLAGYGAQRLIAELAAQPATPAAPGLHEWAVAADGPGRLAITLRTAPQGSDTRLSGFEISLDGGPWAPLEGLNPPLAMTATVANVAAGPRTVAIRALSPAGAGPASAAKVVTAQ